MAKLTDAHTLSNQVSHQAVQDHDPAQQTLRDGVAAICPEDIQGSAPVNFVKG